MKKEIYTCDIKNCGNNAKHLSITIQVIFVTEQTEGRCVTPYLQYPKLDICEECYLQITKERKTLEGEGAQGFNTYYFTS